MTLLREEMELGTRVLLVGPPGCGKTALVADTCRATDRKLVVVRAGLMDRLDAAGAVVADHASGVARLLPLDFLRELQATKEPTCILLDDLGQAPLDVQASLMRWFDSGYFPDCVVVWGATNRPSDRAGVSGLVEPLRSRFNASYYISLPGLPAPDGVSALCGPEETLRGWVGWACTAGASPELVAFHSATEGQHLYRWKPVADPGVRMPDFRTWEAVIKLELHLSSAGSSLSPERLISRVGSESGMAYLAFRELADQCPPVANILANPDRAPTPKDPSVQFLVGFQLALSTKVTTVEHCDNACKYLRRLNEQVAALAHSPMRQAQEDRCKREGRPCPFFRSAEWNHFRRECGFLLTS